MTMTRYVGKLVLACVSMLTILVTAHADPVTQRTVDSCLSDDQFDNRISSCSAVIQSGQWSGKTLARAYFNRGDAHFAKGDVARAITDYDSAIGLDPGDEKALHNRGYAYASVGDFDRAITDYSRALEVNPQFPSAYRQRGLAYVAKRDYSRAIADFDSAIKVAPSFADAYKNRGDVFKLKGDLPRAANDYQMAITKYYRYNVWNTGLLQVVQQMCSNPESDELKNQCISSLPKLIATARAICNDLSGDEQNQCMNAVSEKPAPSRNRSDTNPITETPLNLQAGKFDVLVFIEGKSLLKRNNLQKLRDLAVDLQLVEGVRGFVSLFSTKQSTELGGSPRALFPAVLPAGPAYENFIETVKANDTIRGKLLSEDGTVTSMVLSLEPEVVASKKLIDTIDHIRKLLDDDLRDTDLKVRLSGTPVGYLKSQLRPG